MSNNVTIQLTKFVDVKPDGSEGETTYGFRVTDSYGADYADIYTAEDIINKTPAEWIALIRESGDVGREMIDHAKENRDGIFFGDKFLTWVEIGE